MLINASRRALFKAAWNPVHRVAVKPMGTANAAEIQRVPILIYHHVYLEDAPELAAAFRDEIITGAGVIGEAAFRRQLDYIVDSGWEVSHYVITHRISWSHAPLLLHCGTLCTGRSNERGNGSACSPAAVAQSQVLCTPFCE